jgi:hypothetical protein
MSQKPGAEQNLCLSRLKAAPVLLALAMVQNEAQAALDDGVINEVIVVYGDKSTRSTPTKRATKWISIPVVEEALSFDLCSNTSEITTTTCP